jgi:hypothetical protein
MPRVVLAFLLSTILARLTANDIQNRDVLEDINLPRHITWYGGS